MTLFLVMESGVGGGIVIDGALFRGAHGLAGEIGHLLVPDGAGRMRALEDVIGLENVLAAYGAGARRRAADARRASSPGCGTASPARSSIAEDWARTLAYGLVQVCRMVDPDRIVLGGSVAALYPLVAARVAAHIRATQEASFPMPAIAITTTATAGRRSAPPACCTSAICRWRASVSPIPCHSGNSRPTPACDAPVNRP